MCACRVRSWLGCLNNYSNAELDQLKAHECRYMALGFHVGLKSKLPHVHILLEYKNAKVRPKFNPRIHWESRRGTLKQALDYLNKEDKLEERGDRPRLDQKICTSFEDMYEDAVKGELHPESQMYARYRNYFDNIATAHMPPVILDGELPDKNIWIWGKKGLGKTGIFYRLAIDTHKSLYDKPINKWWDGYGGQEYVLMEDVDEDNIQYLVGHLKKWVDRYSFNAEIKGGSIRIVPNYHLIVTSNYPPSACLKRAEDVEAIERRFDVYHIESAFDVRPPPVAAPPRPANPTPPCSQTYESETELASSWH